MAGMLTGSGWGGGDNDETLLNYWQNPESAALQSRQITRQYLASDTQLPSYCISLDQTKAKYNAVRSVVSSTWESELVGIGRDARGLGKLKYDRIQVARIWDVQNQDVLCKYGNKLRAIPKQSERISNVKTAGNATLSEMLHPEKNEVFLFHGTQEISIAPIVANGLKISKRGVMFGQGVYFAESSTKSDQYTDDENRRSERGQELYMLLARVTLGKIYHKDDASRVPPTAELKASGYNSIVATKQPPDRREVAGDKLLFREFVVFDADQCYPEFLVEYKRI